jgi:hypothetical protein
MRRFKKFMTWSLLMAAVIFVSYKIFQLTKKYNYVCFESDTRNTMCKSSKTINV